MAQFSARLFGGAIIDPASGRRGTYDVAFDGHRVAVIEAGVDHTKASQAIDISGHVVVPGFVDVHSHAFRSIGDATVLRIFDVPFTLRDVDGRTMETNRRIIATGVVRGGAYYIPAR